MGSADRYSEWHVANYVGLGRHSGRATEVMGMPRELNELRDI